MDITRISKRLAEHYGESLGYTEEKKDLLRFGFEIIIGEGVKFLTLIIIALTYGILPEMLTAIITFIPFRFVSGGAHNDTHEGCFVMTTLCFTGIAVVGSAAAGVLGQENTPLLAAAFVISAAVITIWAPAENKNRPVKLENRKRLKCYSYLLLIFWAISAAAVKKLMDPTLHPGLLSGSALALLFHSFILSPYGFRFMRYTDNIIHGKGGIEHGHQV